MNLNHFGVIAFMADKLCKKKEQSAVQPDVPDRIACTIKRHDTLFIVQNEQILVTDFPITTSQVQIPTSSWDKSSWLFIRKRG